MPYNKEAVEELMARLNISKFNLFDKINKYLLKNGSNISSTTFYRYLRETNEPSLDFIDSLYFISNENGINNLDFYTNPIKEKNNRLNISKEELEERINNTLEKTITRLMDEGKLILSTSTKK